MSGEDGTLNLALWAGDGGVEAMVVIGVGRIIELDKHMGREKGIAVVDGKGAGFVME